MSRIDCIMSSRIVIVFPLLLFSLLVHARSVFQSGYIITLNKDTLYGEIDYRGDQYLGNECSFRGSAQNATKDYRPGEIAGYRFIDDQFFVSKQISLEGSNHFVFLEFLVNGKRKVYYYRESLTNADRLFIEKEDMELVELTYQEEIRYNGDDAYVHRSTKHKGLLSLYMQDAEGFEEKAFSIKKTEYRSVIKLAENYHYSVCKEEDCIVYRREVPFIKLELSLIADYRGLHIDDIIMSGKQNPGFGVQTYFWMPRVNERLFFKTGLLYRKNVMFGEEFFLNRMPAGFSVPLMIEYRYNQWKLKPIAAYGFTLDQWGDYLNVSTTINLGLRYPLTQNIMLGANGSIQTYSALVILPSQKLFSSGLNFEIAYKL